ncbi:BTAD domain-containing putative transcriptional regulator [Streptomyces sp. NPDC091377]|uniref:BTAD domain-containing putative transcriptional regulator n=1 Tax=Streptomyces sp. NPDC091377 TaxID=3365995 RepID=UPI0037F41DF8
MRYRILGSTQAFRPDGTAVPVGGARLRALLTVLASRPGRIVTVPVLVGEVWDGEPPADAPGAVQALVGRLRRALGADAVESLEGGYRLVAAPDDIDLHRFERLADEGRRALADGDPAKAAAVLDDALALWRGPALADLPDRTAQAARWETRRLEARRTRLTAALALGAADRVLPELTALCDAHPLDEPLQALRLRALRDTGRTAEALAAYDAVRRLLAERLGSDPGPELRALHTEMLRAEPPAPPPAAARRPGNLRSRLTSFVGRDADIADIHGDLGTARLVTLLGPGGAGKTRLSQEAAETVRDQAPDGVWLAELAPVEDPAAVPEAVLTALGARQTVLYGAGAEEMRVAVADRHDDPVDRLVEHCGPRRMLIVLDNCEHVVDAAARLVAELLARCPRLTVLATSREPLGVPGELLRPVEPLPEPFALRLLADRGAAARPGFRIEDDPGAAAEICRRLDGLPLAIELAAARLRMLTPRQIADRLDDRFRLLTGGSRTALPRQQTLRAVVDWSWELLDEDEREVLRRLSVFAGGCDLAAAEAVCGPAALDTLGSLVDKSLVVAAPDAAEGMRYRLLETVGEYAAERLAESGRRTGAERAHLTYYREFARTSDRGLRGGGQRAAIADLEREYENIRTALRRAVAARDEQEALNLTHALIWYWQMRDLRIEGRNWCAEVMALGPDPFTEPPRRARPVWQRVTDAPPPLSGEALLEARRGVHLAHLGCMDTEMDLWQTERAQQKLLTIAQVYEPGLPQVCRSPGSSWYFAVLLTGGIDRLQEIVDAAVRTCRETPGYEWELAGALNTRANLLANRTDQADSAAADAEEALRLHRRLGDDWGIAEALSARGEAQERRGEHALAAADFETAIQHAERLGARTQVAVLHARLGGALAEGGEVERAEAVLRGVLDRSESPLSEAMPAARLYLSGLLSVAGRVQEARAELTRLREDFRLAQFPVFDAYILGAEAWLDAAEGEYESCLANCRQALELSGDPLSRAIQPTMQAVYLTVAAIALAEGDDGRRAPDAARCLGAAAALLSSGHVEAASERRARERATASARAALGDEAYDTAHAQGRGLSADEAAALL